jgi:NADH-quinone oxidoreductase subunit N
VLVFVLVVGSAIGLFYYLRIVVAMFSQPGAEGLEVGTLPVVALTPASSLVLAVLTFLLLWFGVYPAPLIRMIQSAVGSLI